MLRNFLMCVYFRYLVTCAKFRRLHYLPYWGKNVMVKIGKTKNLKLKSKIFLILMILWCHTVWYRAGATWNRTLGIMLLPTKRYFEFQIWSSTNLVSYCLISSCNLKFWIDWSNNIVATIPTKCYHCSQI